MEIRTSLTKETAPEYYTSKKYSFVGSAYDMWKLGGNCTHYAYARSCEIAGKNINHDMRNGFPNASQWIYGNKWKTGDTPEQGAVAVFGGTGTAGHVAVVEEVYEDGSYLISQSSYKDFIFNTKKLNLKKGDLYNSVSGKLLGFIYNPYANAEPVPTYSDGIKLIADDVIAGKYGNGATNRKNAIYKEVQSCVNDKLAGKI